MLSEVGSCCCLAHQTKYLADVYMSKHKSLLPSHVSQLSLEGAHFVRDMQNALNATCKHTFYSSLTFGVIVLHVTLRLIADLSSPFLSLFLRTITYHPFLSSSPSWGNVSMT